MYPLFKRLILAASTAVLFGCANKAADPREISFMYWGDIDEIKIVDSLLEQFRQAHPELKVRNQRVSAGGPPYDEKLMTMFAAGTQPDVFLISSYYFGNYAKEGILADLSERSKASPTLGFKDHFPEVVELFSKDGKVYGIPRDVAPVACLYYNKDHFRKMGVPFPDKGWTWPEPFLTYSKKLTTKDKDGKTEVWGYLDDWALYDAFVYSNGASDFDNNLKPTRCVLDSPAALEALQFYGDLINKHKVLPSAFSLQQVAGMTTSGMFTNGKAAMFYSGSWLIPGFRNITAFDWDVALPPKSKRTGKRGYQGGGSAYAVSGRISGEKLDNAWKLAEFFTSPEALGQFAGAGLLQPSNKAVASGPKFLDGKKPLNKGILIEALKETYPQPSLHPFREMMAEGLGQAIEAVRLGTKTAAEALPPAVAKANAKHFPKAP